MSVCIHGNLCKEYWLRDGIILSQKCPKNCPYFEEKDTNLAYQRDIIISLRKRIEVLEFLLTYSSNDDDFTKGVDAQRKEELTMLKKLLKNRE